MKSKIRTILPLFGIIVALHSIAWLNYKNADPNKRFLTLDRIWILELPLVIALAWEFISIKKSKK